MFNSDYLFFSIIYILLYLCIFSVLFFLRLQPALLFLQQEEYDNSRFARLLLQSGRLWFRVLPFSKPKKPLKYTLRIKLLLFLSFAIFWIGFKGGAILIFGYILAPFILLMANILVEPVVRLMKFYEMRQIKNKIASSNAVFIAIVGSYGKTSVKHFLHTVLSQKFKVEMTKESYNTLLGICSEVKRKLKPSTEFFITEMGVYDTGEVREMAKLVSPTHGIITSIGPEHFERFKSMDKIIAANSELVEALPENGLAVFNGDNEFCRTMAKKTKSKVLFYGLHMPKASLAISEVVFSEKGSSFILHYNGKESRATTQVLGHLALTNILGAATLALDLGMSLDEVVTGIAKIKPVSHRLQILPSTGGAVVIDDAYNSNPEGAADALDVLSLMQGKKKILVTPGMVELGALQFEKNKTFAASAAHVCDVVIIVGETNRLALLHGLESEQFPAKNIYQLKDLTEVTSLLGKISTQNTVILFENDLPDIYR